MYYSECDTVKKRQLLNHEIEFRTAELEGLLQIIGENSMRLVHEKPILQRELNGEKILHLNIHDCCEFNQKGKQTISNLINRSGPTALFHLDYITPEFAINYEI